MFVRVKAYGVYRFVKSQNTEELGALKLAPDFDVDLDENGEIKLFTGAEVSEVLNPSANQKVDLADALGIKKTTRKTTKKA